ncbi:diguanylate cyclase [Anopheles sinensis]|uniref:Diguanylate cyclase n=1 Tax=Anopheles sinensis TaxID=74873 RepID=A0A084WGB7_ANOSI|nr:diguanylate cyclase [Anopheles sinensis]
MAHSSPELTLRLSHLEPGAKWKRERWIVHKHHRSPIALAKWPNAQRPAGSASMNHQETRSPACPYVCACVCLCG